MVESSHLTWVSFYLELLDEILDDPIVEQGTHSGPLVIVLNHGHEHIVFVRSKVGKKEEKKGFCSTKAVLFFTVITSMFIVSAAASTRYANRAKGGPEFGTV